MYFNTTNYIWFYTYVHIHKFFAGFTVLQYASRYPMLEVLKLWWKANGNPSELLKLITIPIFTPPLFYICNILYEDIREHDLFLNKFNNSSLKLHFLGITTECSALLTWPKHRSVRPAVDLNSHHRATRHFANIMPISRLLFDFWQ